MNKGTFQLALVLSRTWWVLLLRGLFAIAFGVTAWLLPEVSVAVLLILFGIYVLADGVLGVWTAVSGRKERDHWWALLVWGLLGVSVGVLTLVNPALTAIALMFYIAIWAIATGVLQIVLAVRLRKEISGEWLLVLGGLLSVVLGGFLMAQPMMGAIALLWVIATYAVIFGVVFVVLAFKARSFGKRLAS